MGAGVECLLGPRLGDAFMTGCTGGWGDCSKGAGGKASMLGGVPPQLVPLVVGLPLPVVSSGEAQKLYWALMWPP